MKKVLALICAFTMIFALVGCGEVTKEQPLEPNGQSYGSNQTKNSPSDRLSLNEGIVADVAMEAGAYEGALDFNTEEYNTLKENGFISVATTPLSTFAIDVDTGSYCNFRRMINKSLTEEIPTGAIRTEEMLNYFDYTVDNVSDGKFSMQYEMHECPWDSKNGLILMTIQANPVEIENKGNNFVFLVDTSGSMGYEDADEKIELAKKAFKLLAKQLTEKDTVSIVTYAGAADTLLDGCKGNEYNTIERTLDSISTEGGTNGSGGISAAYECAVKHFIEGGNNRVILASDGDMNLGITSQSGLVDLIKEKKELGVFLTTLGFGSGNYSDANMEQIADAGNGNYFYIDNIDEAQRVLVDKMMQTTVTVAKDVKLQVEFNPTIVSKYRLLGYENRTMSADDFSDDTKDGGEVGAGQQVTVMYEVEFSDGKSKAESKSDLKYQDYISKGNDKEILNLAIRYKEPNENKSTLEEYAVNAGESDKYSADYYFAASIAEVASILRESEYVGTATIDSAIELANKGINNDKTRTEYLDLIKKLK